MKTKTKVIVASLAVVLLAALVGGLLWYNSPSQKLDRMLRLGQEYLMAEDYENAITAFDAVLAIDPENERALKGETDAYLAWFESVYDNGNGDTDKAIELLSEGFAKTNDKRLSTRLNEIKNMSDTDGVEVSDEDSSKSTPYELSEIDLDSYADAGFGMGGVIPVYDGNKWGAINYEGKQIIPFEYDDFRAPNNKGYSVFSVGEGKSASYTVFDNTGKAVYTSSDCHICASSEAFVVARDHSSGGKAVTVYEYYTYDGGLITSYTAEYQSDISDIEGEVIGIFGDVPHGFYDGKSIITGNMKSEVYDLEEMPDYAGYRPFDFGLVSIDGSIEWIDGDGIDEDDSKYVSFDEINAAIHEAYPNLMAAGASTQDNEYAVNSINNGYFVSETMVEYVAIVRNKDGMVAAFDPFSFAIGNDGELDVGKYTYDYRNNIPIYSGNSDTNLESEWKGYYSDGDYFYNYGSKVIVASNGKYALLDFANGDFSYKTFDYCGFKDEKWWLISADDQWGYIDHDGNVQHMYDDASDFTGGYALIVENGNAYIIDENYEKVADIGAADRVYASGGLLIAGSNGVRRVYAVR